MRSALRSWSLPGGSRVLVVPDAGPGVSSVGGEGSCPAGPNELRRRSDVSSERLAAAEMSAAQPESRLGRSMWCRSTVVLPPSSDTLNLEKTRSRCLPGEQQHTPSSRHAPPDRRRTRHSSAPPDAAFDRYPSVGGLVRLDYARSKRSRFMTLSHAATKSRTNFSSASSDP